MSVSHFPPDTVQYRRGLVGLVRAERAIEHVVLDVLDDWLEATRFAVHRELRSALGLTAAGYSDPSAAVDAAAAAYNVWRRGLNNELVPQIGIAYGEAYRQIRDGSPAHRHEIGYLEQVSDRLKAWPAGVFEDMRPLLIDAVTDGDDYEQIADRIGAVLGIDARTRALRAEISEVENRLQHEDLGPVTRRALAARRRILWAEHDESLGEWRWKARRIARTEAHAASESARLRAAQDIADAAGIETFKRWKSARDRRVRATHRVADGQIVKLADPFRVGVALLQFPGDPAAMAPQEVINCRCVTAVQSGEQVQAGLQGSDGSIGEVKPGGVRLGPDDPGAVGKAVDDAEPAPRRGERDEPVPSADQLATLSDDALVEVLARAHDDGDDDLYDAADAEWVRREDSGGIGEALDDPDEPNAGPDEVTIDDGLVPPPEDSTDLLAPGDEPPLGGPTPEDADALAAYLDEAMPGDDLDADERAAVERWQGMDRFYQRVQRELRGESGSPEAERIVDVLDDLIDAHPLGRDVVAWRGIRNAHAMFGVHAEDLGSIVGATLQPGGFIATSVAREVAVSFTDPGRDPVILRLLVASHVGALWVAKAGNPQLRSQQELLFAPAALYIVGVRQTDEGLVQVDVEMR
ncbi:MAG: phage minor head protein [Gordonia sp. (in: high G+C Gram-positive bacteria)]